MLTSASAAVEQGNAAGCLGQEGGSPSSNAETGGT
eukprot:CAMPEP_0177671992 /NCGR_PEP_ID=MMETSP0447-20121125/25058_1 /TAXON_ID=0 /ORGANISM="Stygamoeba regulata, Strain BSH-02190019" /LENGTH=34 /DNA_ID= /DNA_START= /DNA_END= /DNA_ORIENTATION=